MNARLDYQTDFLGAIYWNDQVMFNQYHIDIKMRTVSMDSDENNIALDRIRYIINEVMTNSIFVHDDDRSAVKKLESAGMKVVVLPEIPVDQIVGMMLFCKLTSVTEDHMEIGQLSIRSSLGEGIIYHQDASETVGPFEAAGWWRDPEPKVQSAGSSTGKVVKLQKSLTWKDLDLHWPDDEDHDDEEQSANNVEKTVVAFRKDEKE